jgi:putative PEP-CTERM system histidine kinase
VSELNIPAVGYFLCVLAFTGLLVLLLTSWRGGRQGGTLVAAVVVTILWSGYAGVISLQDYSSSLNLAIIELLRAGAWLAFLLSLILGGEHKEAVPSRSFRALARLVSVILVVELGFLGYAELNKSVLPSIIGFDLRVLSHIILAVIGLIIIEQMFRNASPQQRWNIKFLCLGIGGMLAYDFYVYADALLLREMNAEVWGARGYINVMVVPLLAISAARNPEWSLEMHVSRRFVFHSTTMMAAGIYLLAMAAGGYYIKAYGGSWGGIAQLTFLFGALILLAILMFSGQMRARVRVFLSKNFFNYRYDYREEWLKFTNSLSQERLDGHLRARVIQALGELMECSGGMLWQRQDNGHYHMVESVNMAIGTLDERLFDRDNDSLVQFLEQRQWVVDIDDYNQTPESYEGLELPEWVSQTPEAWLIVPLLQQNQLYGFMLLGRSRVRQKINWEDRDLLITTGRGATNYLALLDTNEALFNARQFETFNRLSAYVVHDLKNVIAQLALVVKNAAKHKHNPAFMDDAINTVDNAVGKMDRMLAQLRKDRDMAGDASRINLVTIAREVVQARSVDKPAPTLQTADDTVLVVADGDRMQSVIAHMVQNAQEATPDNGCVTVRIAKARAEAVLDIEDNGSGMDKQFIQERLFRPFDTTKGNAGMGIGVYESREFIQSLGGRLDVKSEPGKGTLFSIHLALVEEQPESEMPLDHTTLN